MDAIRKLLEKTGWTATEVDLWEINEAFAVVTMAAMQEHGLSHDRVNVHGGACALGHPIGASGARILTTLIGMFAVVLCIVEWVRQSRSGQAQNAPPPDPDAVAAE